jgi:hypothetical protein
MIAREDRLRHVHVLGRTGVGKSTLLLNQIRGDIERGAGVCVIDPHGDLAEAVARSIPRHRTNDVIYFDPADDDFSVAFNPLACSDPARRDLVADDVLAAFEKVYDLTHTPRLKDTLRNALYVLVEKGMAERITGGLSRPSKMPEWAWGLSAARCKLGSVLAETPSSVCSSCYARKGRYRLTKVKAKLDDHYRGLEHSLWVPAMVLLIRWNVGRYFRWFDSGDIQGPSHLQAICDVARHTSEVLHWLPTQEHDLVREFQGCIPDNLVVRLSAHMLDAEPPAWSSHTSSVFTQHPASDSHECPAPEQGNVCGACRACWSKQVSHVSYRLH